MKNYCDKLDDIFNRIPGGPANVTDLKKVHAEYDKLIREISENSTAVNSFAITSASTDIETLINHAISGSTKKFRLDSFGKAMQDLTTEIKVLKIDLECK